MVLRIELRTGLSGLEGTAWDALTGEDDPFVEYGFLRALEESESVGAEAGWQPLHVTLWRDDTLIGALPLYAKDNSWGEYIFDFAWARAASQAGVPYYPKLVAMAPFTPATGRRLLALPGEDRSEVAGALVAGARAAADEIEASSVHLLFVTEAEREVLTEHDLDARLSLQFHWDNEGYASFEDYLGRFRSSKRKQVKKERRKVAESGLDVVVKEGGELDDTDWAALGRFYRINCLRHGSYPYLTPRFFSELRARHAHRVVSAIAYASGGEPVAMSLNFQKGRHLYGRYWGCGEDHEFLHFELCYYRLIERAIDQGLRHFEAGAQGRHKLKRGLMPSAVHSCHWIRHPSLARAVRDFLPAEACDVREQMALLAEDSPFHRGDG
ncbi:MAG: GNAT family N-acetyltransferase [Sandaracinaceae bacterium]